MRQAKFGEKTIFFEEQRHLFTDEDGKFIPSVTGFTSVIDKSGVLVNWAVKIAREYLEGKLAAGEQITLIDVAEACKEHQRKKEQAADIGTKIHEWISRWIAGEKPDFPEEEKIANGVRAFLKFQDEYGLKWTGPEQIVFSPKYWYAGILDAIALKGKERILVDFKSANGIYEENAFQIAGYQLAYEEYFKRKIAYRMVVRFGKDTGEFEFRKFKDNQKDIEAFLACLKLRNRLKELKG
ncbi:hypothetical protein COT64_02575 [Candidatus Shapirobacteria bacterium CG09_land_8_20_14_0_10_39_12]|uniref:PD-(D/E)XK endonuclease-like domain-containing protein n=1 Tax=Candidatus Shapirobacteria bacterium CG09_land_8_20_14_0_10_39_12 TaxID=1974885 RepID=A0A2H0WP81_9BACT|nr:MAG: hypothetical protein COT64_02575 [Candidatus Shapirobacteria bacterium CG09_land_8_20_14_0_10_39_12]